LTSTTPWREYGILVPERLNIESLAIFGKRGVDQRLETPDPLLQESVLDCLKVYMLEIEDNWSTRENLESKKTIWKAGRVGHRNRVGLQRWPTPRDLGFSREGA
jgi:hypothetical protein